MRRAGGWVSHSCAATRATSCSFRTSARAYGRWRLLGRGERIFSVCSSRRDGVLRCCGLRLNQLVPVGCFPLRDARRYTSDSTQQETQEEGRAKRNFNATEYVNRLNQWKKEGKDIFVHPADMYKLLAASQWEKWLKQEVIEKLELVKGGRTVYYNKIIDKLLRMNERYQAMRLVGRMEQNGIPLDIFTFNMLIRSSNAKEERLKLLAGMKAAGVAPDLITYTTMIDFYASNEDSASAVKMLDEMKRNGVKPDVYVYSALMKAYRAAKDLEGATELLKHMKAEDVKPNLITWMTYLEVCETQKQLDWALSVLPQMRRQGLRPDIKVFTILVKISTMLKGTKIETVLRELESEGDAIQPDMRFYTALINLFGQNRDVPQAFETLMAAVQTGLKPDFITFSSLIAACCVAGNVSLAFDTLFQMRLQGFNPDYRIFESLLRACEEGQDIERAVGLLNGMIADRGGLPGESMLLSFLRLCENTNSLERAFPIITALERAEAAAGGKERTVIGRRVLDQFLSATVKVRDRANVGKVLVMMRARSINPPAQLLAAYKKMPDKASDH